MLWWTKKQDAPVAGPATAMVDGDAESAVEAVADVLRALGQNAFDLGDNPASAIAETFERWAAHILVRGPAPGETVEDDVPSAPPPRQWGKLSRFVTAHRRKEQQHVVETTAEMRDAILMFVRCLGRTSLEQGKASRRLRARVDRLRASVESNSLDELKASALGLAEAVTQTLEEQDRLMQAQRRDLRAKLMRLQNDLDEAKCEGATDPLTKLQNRRTFDAALERSVALAAVVGRPVCLVMVDVDNFKSVNDRFGHPVGDRVLCAIADALTRSFPRRGDVVARYGGEEFACLFPDTTQQDARMLTERLLTAIRKLRIDNAGETFTVTVSAGVGEHRQGESEQELVARVDRALYEAKRTGRNRVVDATMIGDLEPATALAC